MNKSDIMYAAKVMEAAANGEEVEWRPTPTDTDKPAPWHPCDAPKWRWDTCDYRIKPKAPTSILAITELWIGVTRRGLSTNYTVYHSREQAEKAQTQYILHVTVNNVTEGTLEDA